MSTCKYGVKVSRFGLPDSHNPVDPAFRIPAARQTAVEISTRFSHEQLAKVDPNLHRRSAINNNRTACWLRIHAVIGPRGTVRHDIRSHFPGLHRCIGHIDRRHDDSPSGMCVTLYYSGEPNGTVHPYDAHARSPLRAIEERPQQESSSS